MSTFKAIFEGLLIADWFAIRGSRSAAGVTAPWQGLLLEIAEDCVRGRHPSEAQVGSRLRRVESESVAGCLLAASPLLLVNVDRYGHRHGALRQWAGQTGLSAPTMAALGELFMGLCQLQQHGAAIPSLPRGEVWRESASSAFSTPCLVAACRLLAQGQWQFGLSLRLAQQYGWGSADRGLIALLATLRGGAAAIPLTLRQKLWVPFPDGADDLASRGGWSIAERQRLMELSHGLYCRWGGISPLANLSEEINDGSRVITI